MPPLRFSLPSSTTEPAHASCCWCCCCCCRRRCDGDGSSLLPPSPSCLGICRVHKASHSLPSAPSRCDDVVCTSGPCYRHQRSTTHSASRIATATRTLHHRLFCHDPIVPWPCCGPPHFPVGNGRCCPRPGRRPWPLLRLLFLLLPLMLSDTTSRRRRGHRRATTLDGSGRGMLAAARRTPRLIDDPTAATRLVSPPKSGH